MKLQKALIRKRVVKIVNSRLKVEIKDDFLCEKDLQTELGATTQDFQAILLMVERFFNIVFDDEELDEIYSVNNIVNFVEAKTKTELFKMVLEHN